MRVPAENSHDASYEETLRCTRCGQCQAVCPIYAIDRQEPAVARGKLQMIRNLHEGSLPPTAELRERVFLCLLCGACRENCPSGVDFPAVLLAARRQLAEDLGLRASERILLRGLLADPGLMELGGRALALYQRTVLRWLAHRLRLLEALPGRLGEKESLLPDMSLAPARLALPVDASPGNVRTQVAYYLGCVTNVAYPSLARAVVSVLRRNRCRVLTPRDLRCCGMPHQSYGDAALAAQLAQHNVQILNATGAEAIVTDCASCSHVLKAYSGLDAPVYDINEYLVDVLGVAEPEMKARLKVTYHDPCHLVRFQNVRAAPRTLLRAVPGVELVEMAEADRCCGGGGSFALLHYDLARRILDRKIGNARATGAQVIATSCPSCRLQIAHGLRASGESSSDSRTQSAAGVVDVLHPVEVLQRAYLWGTEVGSSSSS